MRLLESPPVRSIARFAERLGLLPILALLGLGVGVSFHVAYYPGVPYTWERPARILWRVLSGSYFANFALGVFALGFATRLRDEPFRQELEAYVAALRGSPDWPRLRRVLVASATGVVLAWGLMPAYTPADLLSVFIAGLYVGFRRPAARDWARFWGELLLIVLLFTAVSYSFTVVKSLLFRLTQPHDAAIVALERALFLGATPHRAIASWAAQRPWAIWLADKVYYLFFQHMFFVSILLVGAGRREERLEYTGSLAFCYLAGGVTYFLWPGRGPFSFDPAAFTYLREWPTLTAQFQRLLEANTAEAAQGRVSLLQTYEYVACMPSLHMAHELVMLWFSRRSRPFFLLSLAFTILTFFAIVILGWHYPIDALAGALLAALAIVGARRTRRFLLPRVLEPAAPRPEVRLEPGPGSGPLVGWSALALVAAAAAAVAIPFLSVAYAPITDLPQQVSQIRLLGEALGDSASPYRVQWGTPYLLSYLALGISWLAVGPAAAGRLAMMAIGLAWLAAAVVLARRRGRPAEAPVLACLLFFNHSTYWGFYSFVTGLPVFVLWFAWTEDMPERLGWRDAAKLLAGGLLLYAAHALWLAAGLAWLISRAAVRHGARGLSRRLVAILPLILLAGAWWSTFRQTSFATPAEWGAPEKRLLPGWFADAALGGLRGPLEPALLAGLALWAGVALFHHRRALGRALDLPLLAAAALFVVAALVLPNKYMNTIHLPQRWVPVAAFLAILALPPLPAKASLRGLAAAAIAAAFSLSTAVAWRHFERVELAGLDDALRALPQAPGVLGLDFVKQSEAVRGRPFIQTFAMAQVLRGGRLNFSFAEFAPSLVVFREGAARSWTPGLEWFPERLRRSDITQFGYLVVHADEQTHRRFATLPELSEVTSGARWRLYRVEAGRRSPGGAPPPLR